MTSPARFLVLAASLLLLPAMGGRAADPEPIAAVDVDGRPVQLNATGKITAVLSSSPDTQDRTRTAGAALDRFRGRKDFGLVIVVDLRGSLAGLAQGYVRDRMKRDLDSEAERLRPSFAANGNTGNPRAELEAVADFDGAVVDALRWNKDSGKLRATLFGPDGREIRKWDDLRDPRELDRAATRSILTADLAAKAAQQAPSPAPAPPAQAVP